MRPWVPLRLVSLLFAGSAAAQEDKKTDDLKSTDLDWRLPCGLDCRDLVHLGLTPSVTTASRSVAAQHDSCFMQRIRRQRLEVRSRFASRVRARNDDELLFREMALKSYARCSLNRLG